MFKWTLVTLSITVSFGIASNIFFTTLIFLLKVAGYKKSFFKVLAHKDFLFKTGFGLMVLKYGVCIVEYKVLDILVKA